MRFHLAVIAALAASPAWAGDQAKHDKKTGARTSDASDKQTSSDKETSSEKDTPKGLDGYGYGTQPAQEAKESSAKQSNAPARAKSSAPQDERGDASSRAAEREGSHQRSEGSSTTNESQGDTSRATPSAKPEDHTSPADGDSGSAGASGSDSKER
jgi:hypothetical protein